MPSVLNTAAHREPWKKPHSSEGSLSQGFQTISRLLGSPTIDTFASRLCHQLPQYITWYPNPYIHGTDAMIQNWNLGL